MQSRILQSPSHNEWLVQVGVDDRDVQAILRPRDLMDSIRVSLAEKIARKMFEMVEPKIIEALKGEQNAKDR